MGHFYFGEMGHLSFASQAEALAKQISGKVVSITNGNTVHILAPGHLTHIMAGVSQ